MAVLSVSGERRAVGRREQDAVDALVGELLDDLLLADRSFLDGRAFPDEFDVELLGRLLGAADAPRSRTMPASPWESSRA